VYPLGDARALTPPFTSSAATRAAVIPVWRPISSRRDTTSGG